jgi:hypothetical protein
MTETPDPSHKGPEPPAPSGRFCVLCASYITLGLISFIFLFGSALEGSLGLEARSVATTTVYVYREALAPLISFVADLVRSFFPWPFLILLVLIALFRYPGRTKEALAGIGRLEFPWFAYESAAARAPSQALRKELGEAEAGVERANKELEEAYRTANSYAASLRDKHEIPPLVSHLAAKVAEVVGRKCPDDFRLTLYVRDFVFEDRLYQFTEYYDRRGERMTRDKVGRTLSIRYGIVGRVWRSGVNEVEGDLLSKEDNDQINKDGRSRKNPSDLERFIARRWGLTLDEAVYISRYNSYGALRINRGGVSVGLVYFDSKERDAFGSGDETVHIRRQIEHEVENSVLAERLLEIAREAKPWSGRIYIFETPR